MAALVVTILRNLDLRGGPHLAQPHHTHVLLDARLGPILIIVNRINSANSIRSMLLLILIPHASIVAYPRCHLKFVKRILILDLVKHHHLSLTCKRLRLLHLTATSLVGSL